MLKEYCKALGWQGGTCWQVLAEIKRLKNTAQTQKDSTMIYTVLTEDGMIGTIAIFGKERDILAHRYWVKIKDENGNFKTKRCVVKEVLEIKPDWWE